MTDVTDVTYLFGYQNKRYTLAQINQFPTWNKVHPELRRRLIALCDAARKAGFDLGIGSGWRSTEQQIRLFLSRYSPAPTGVYWNGQYWRRHTGAPVAPPGSSYHESTDPLGYALAVDMLNYRPAIDWANMNDRAFGVNDFEAVNDEEWHYQPLEIPSARRNYNPNIHTIKFWTLPGSVPPIPPAPTCTVSRILKRGFTGNDVRCLQTALKTHYLHPQPAVVVDGQFGPQTEIAVKNYQNVMRLTVDGIAGPITLTSLRIWRAP